MLNIVKDSLMTFNIKKHNAKVLITLDLLLVVIPHLSNKVWAHLIKLCNNLKEIA